MPLMYRVTGVVEILKSHTQTLEMHFPLGAHK